MNALGAGGVGTFFFFRQVPQNFRQFTDPDSPHIKGVFRLGETAFCFGRTRSPSTALGAARQRRERAGSRILAFGSIAAVHWFARREGRARASSGRVVA